MPTPTYGAHMRGYTTTVHARPFTAGISSSDEIHHNVLQPNPGKVPVSAGHWHRDSATAPRKPAPRTNPRPTGGRVDRARGVPQYPRKRTTSTRQPTARELHAMWAKGKLDF